MSDSYNEWAGVEAILDLGEKPWTYAVAFQEAASILADHVRDGVDLDPLVYPVVFNYRQSIELMLKRLFIVCAKAEAAFKNAKLNSTPYPKDHYLDELWKKLKPRLTTLLGTPEGFGRVDACISYLHKLDPTSQASRYWESSHKSDLYQLERIDLGDFMSKCQECAEALMEAEALLDEYVEKAARKPI